MKTKEKISFINFNHLNWRQNNLVVKILKPNIKRPKSPENHFISHGKTIKSLVNYNYLVEIISEELFSPRKTAIIQLRMK